MSLMKYVRLKFEDREEISRLLASKLSIRKIAKQLDRSPSTISREVWRYSRRRSYRAVGAQRSALSCAKSRKINKRKLVLNPKLLELVREKLNLCWSPDQIARYLKKRYKSPKMHISKESIYTYIYVFLRRSLRDEFTLQLRHKHKKRRKRGVSAKGQTSLLEDMTLIDERPTEVNDRLIPGHWEGDIMIGGARAQTALGTLVERTTRYAILVPLKNKTSEEVRRSFAKEIKKLPRELRLTLTYDQGREMAGHKLFTKETKMKVYFAHPQSPWERGTNENTNGLIRQFFPKATNFKKVTRKEIKWVQKALNDRPRKTLNWQTPKEALQGLLH
jgi:transposase, IS30 family